MEPKPKQTSIECRKVFEMLSEYLDAELPADACECVEAHISGCEPCIEFIESLKKSVELCSRYKSEALPPELAADVRRSLKDEYTKMLAARPDCGV